MTRPATPEPIRSERTPRRASRFARNTLLAALLLPLAGCPFSSLEVDVKGLGGTGGALTLRNRVSGEQISVTEDAVHHFVEPSIGYLVEVVVEPDGLDCFVSKAERHPLYSVGAAGKAYVRCADEAGSVDSDGDGVSDRDELAQGSDPGSRDTDGDGYEDGFELSQPVGATNNLQWNPRIADQPRFEIEIVEPPRIVLDYTTQTGSSRMVSTQHGQTLSQGQTRSWGREQSRQVALGHTASGSIRHTVGGEVSIGLTDISASTNWETSVEAGFEVSSETTRGSTLSWNDTQQQENARTWSEHLAETTTEGTTFQGAKLSVAVRVRNPGHIGYDLTGLTLTAAFLDPERPLDPSTIAALTYVGGGLLETHYGPNETGESVIFEADLTLGEAEILARRLLRDSQNFVVEPATGTLECDDGGLLHVGADTTIASHTATVTVDFGSSAALETRSFKVAVDNGDGTQFISARDAMEQVIGYETRMGRRAWDYADGRRLSRTGLERLRVPAAGIDIGLDADASRYWLVAHTYEPSQGIGGRRTDVHNLLLRAWNLWDLKLHAGDEIAFVLVDDFDRDGLDDRFERDFGTDPELADSDGDGIFDAEELYGYALRGCPAAPAPVVFSDPRNPDTDGDLASDGDERDACSDPGHLFYVSAGTDRSVDLYDFVRVIPDLSGISDPVCTWSIRDLAGTEIDAPSGCDLDYQARQVGSFDVTLLVTGMDPFFGPATGEDTLRLDVYRDSSRRVFVGPLPPGAPIDTVRNGSQQAPYPTLAAALATNGGDLYVAAGDSAQLVTQTLEVPSGVSLFGGYAVHMEEGAPVWTRTPARTRIDSYVDGTAISFGSVGEDSYLSGFDIQDARVGAGSNGRDQVLVSVANGSGVNFHVQDTTLTGGSAGVGGSSFALRAQDLAALYLTRSEIRAGAGGTGQAGATGASGAAGSGYGSFGNPGNGGGGGHGGHNSGYNGTKGADRCGVAGGNYGNGRAHSPNHYVGRDGDPGSPGSKGGDASAVGADIDFADARFASGPGGAGSCGANGGGGGGGAATIWWNWQWYDGSWGGQGGVGGDGGQAGSVGGAAVAVASNHVANVYVIDSELSGGIAGSGGAGGRGGSGGAGGAGEASKGGFWVGDDWHQGGRGGRGGAGGRGGDGAGGPGGFAVALLLGDGVGQALLIESRLDAGVAGRGGDNDVTPGAAGGEYGAGGHGGSSRAILAASPVQIEEGCGVVMSPGTPGAGGSGASASGSAGSAIDLVGGVWTDRCTF